MSEYHKSKILYVSYAYPMGSNDFTYKKSRGGKFIEGQQTLYWSLEQFMKEY